mgnify:CR=1 FL=1
MEKRWEAQIIVHKDDDGFVAYDAQIQLPPSPADGDAYYATKEEALKNVVKSIKKLAGQTDGHIEIFFTTPEGMP